MALAAILAFMTPSARGQNTATTVTVTTQKNQHPISRNIYGVSIMDSAGAPDIKALNDPNNRIGGNNVSTYNWDVAAHAPAGVKLPPGDALNLDNDWYWESYLESNAPGGLYDGIIAAGKTAGVGTQTMATIPMMPYIATVSPSATTSAASLWSYSIKKYGAQIGNSCSGGDYLGGNGYAYDEWQTDAGSGVATMNGCTLNYVTNNPADAYVKNSPAIQQAYVAYLVKKYGGAAHGGIKYYILDNEPSIWSGTHHDIHPAAESYDELWADIQAYAGAIRAADPQAIIVGPEEWSWWAMWESGKDQEGVTPSDYSTHGNMYYYPWLLTQLAAYKQKNGMNLIDMLSVHCYDDGGAPPNEATRKLWDPGYSDPGWYGDIGLISGRVIDWIPLMQKWVAAYNPGMPIACSEYTDWDDESTLSGAVTQADLLGIFGQYGYGLASHFGVPGHPAYLAFQMYTNYDGKNSGFGETGVASAVANPDNLSAFAALRAADGALTVIVVDKQSGKTPVTIALPDFAPAANATMYQITSAGQTAISAPVSVPVGGSGIAETLAGPSVTLFVIPKGTVTQKPATPTALRASVGNKVVTLNWNAAVGAASYNLYRSTAASGPFTTVYASVPNTAGDTYNDTAVSDGTTYYYEVSAANTLGQSANSTPPVAATPLLPPLFTSSATASPNPVTQNSTTTMTATVTCTRSSLTNGVVEVIALDPANKVATTKIFTGESFASGQSRTFTAPLTPSATGTYTIEVEVMSASGQRWSTNANAGSVTVNSALAFTASATASPATIAASGSSTASFSVKNTGSAALTNGNVEVQVFNSAGTAVGTGVFSGQNFAAGQTQNYSWTWTPANQSPAVTAAGTYTVEIGVFDGAWSTNYYWNGNAATVKIQ